MDVVLISILYPSQTSESVPKTMPAGRLAAKAVAAAVSKTTTAVPETPVRDTKQSPKKTVTPKKEDTGVVKESPSKKTPKTPKPDEPGEVPPSLEKKKSSYRSFMSRDGPRALGSKPVPEVSFNPVRICLKLMYM